MRALIVEDDERLRQIVRRTLTRLNLACDEADSLEAADELLALHPYDVLVLDRRLPDGDGVQLCRAARERGFANGILMLTALDDARSTIEGLSEGADDYVGKPFDVDVLAARVKALLRRNERRPETVLTAGGLRLDPWKRSVSREGVPLALTARELRLLEALMRAPGAVVSREELMEQAWGEREEPMSNTIDVLIARLRRKLEAAGEGDMIETVRGLGYRLRSG
ncbi:MAG: two-component system, OmpR family, copper resistance phosphate regulon response regulator CusR [Acidobacteriota bacterium]|nr:two-component system, OmpR family, copper resistance phosphate regulon response regulator CusR [Acidobacteriota bacterium]